MNQFILMVRISFYFEHNNVNPFLGDKLLFPRLKFYILLILWAVSTISFLFFFDFVFVYRF